MGTSVDAFRTEKDFQLWFPRKFRESPEEFKRSYPEMAKALENLVIPQLVDNWEKVVSQFWDIQLMYLETPYWKRNEKELKMKMDEWDKAVHPSLKAFLKKEIATPSRQEADVRILVTKSRMHLTQIATALESYRLINRRYPSRLSGLAPQYFAELPVDVFNGREYIYRPSADGISYTLYGVGPDQTDNSGAPVYDPTNGIISAGDLFYK
jgi:hypothetical protein